LRESCRLAYDLAGLEYKYLQPDQKVSGNHPGALFDQEDIENLTKNVINRLLSLRRP